MPYATCLGGRRPYCGHVQYGVLLQEQFPELELWLQLESIQQHWLAVNQHAGLHNLLDLVFRHRFFAISWFVLGLGLIGIGVILRQD